MKERVLILGAGFAGLELTTRLATDLADEVDVTLIDRSDTFIFGFSKLDIMLGRRSTNDVLRLGDGSKRSVPTGTGVSGRGRRASSSKQQQVPNRRRRASSTRPQPPRFSPHPRHQARVLTRSGEDSRGRNVASM